MNPHSIDDRFPKIPKAGVFAQSAQDLDAAKEDIPLIMKRRVAGHRINAGWPSLPSGPVTGQEVGHRPNFADIVANP